MTTHSAVSSNQNYSAAANAAETPAKTRREVFVVNERPSSEGTRSWWTKIGHCYENRDGSWTVRLEALPLTGNLQIRDPQADRERRERVQHAPF